AGPWPSYEFARAVAVRLQRWRRAGAAYNRRRVSSAFVRATRRVELPPPGAWSASTLASSAGSLQSSPPFFRLRSRYAPRGATATSCWEAARSPSLLSRGFGWSSVRSISSGSRFEHMVLGGRCALLGPMRGIARESSLVMGQRPPDAGLRTPRRARGGAAGC